MTVARTTNYGYINIPNNFFPSTKKGEKSLFDNRKLPAGELLAVASVYSLSSGEREMFGIKKKKNSVKFTISSFANRYNVSASTSRRALSCLDSCEKIEKTDDGMYFDADKMQEGKKNGFLRIEEWLFFAQFSGEYLTKSEVLVLARMLSYAKKTAIVKKGFRYIARGLGLSPTLVMNAANKLDRLGIINILERAHNDHGETIYVIQKAYLQEKKVEMQRSLQAEGGDDREKYYKTLRDIAVDRRNAMFQKARQNQRFKEIYDKWYYGGQKDKHLQVILFELLQSMDMTWADITRLRCVCDKCKDTGTLPNGEKCNCYEEKLNK